MSELSRKNGSSPGSDSKFKNVSDNDVQHLSSLSSEWWDKNGPCKPLHILNQARIPFIRNGLIRTGALKANMSYVPYAFKGLKMLDVGCGAGIVTEDLKKLKADIIGMDPSTELLSVAKNHAAANNLDIEYICSTVEDHSIENEGKYDVVVSTEVLEHVPDQRSYLHACVKCLKVGGSIFVSTFNKTTIAWLLAIIAAENIINIVPKGTHDYNMFISPSEVTKMLNEVNCRTINVEGIRYDFWRDTAVLWGYTGINYALHAVKRLKLK